MTDTPFSATITPLEVPGAVREIAEKSVTQVRENYARLKDAAESANGTIEAVYTTASKGATEYGSKLIEIARTNTNSAFDLTAELLTLKTLPQVVELFTTYTRKQVEVLTAQSKEIAELGKKVATETVEPIKASATKAFKNVA